MDKFIKETTSQRGDLQTSIDKRFTQLKDLEKELRQRRPEPQIPTEYKTKLEEVLKDKEGWEQGIKKAELELLEIKRDLLEQSKIAQDIKEGIGDISSK